MKRLLSIAAALLPFAPAALAQPLTFTALPAAVGQIAVVTSRMEFTGKMETKASNGFQGSLPLSHRQSEEIEKETLAVADGAVVRLRLSYRVAEMTEGLDGTELKRQPVVGKTYTLELADGKVAVRDAQGAPVTAEGEKALLQREVETLGQRKRFCEAFAGRSWKVGDAVDPHHREALLSLGVGDSGEIESFRMVLQEILPREGGPLARFDVEVRLHSQPAKDEPEVTFTLRGKLLVDPATCRPVALEAEGPVEMAASEEVEGEKLEMKGSAAAKMSFRAEYRRARPAP